MKNRTPSSPSLSSIIHFSQHVLPPYHLSYNPSSAKTRTHDPWFARPVSTTTPQLLSLVEGKVDVSVYQVTSNQLQILAVTFSADNCNFSNPCK